MKSQILFLLMLLVGSVFSAAPTLAVQPQNLKTVLIVDAPASEIMAKTILSNHAVDIRQVVIQDQRLSSVDHLVSSGLLENRQTLSDPTVQLVVCLSDKPVSHSVTASPPLLTMLIDRAVPYDPVVLQKPWQNSKLIKARSFDYDLERSPTQPHKNYQGFRQVKV